MKTLVITGSDLTTAQQESVPAAAERASGWTLTTNEGYYLATTLRAVELFHDLASQAGEVEVLIPANLPQTLGVVLVWAIEMGRGGPSVCILQENGNVRLLTPGA